MCDTLVVVRAGRVLFGKSSDRDPNEAQLLEWHPRRANARGARVKCTWIDIPEARETHAVVLSRPFWMWGAEIGANEHGVVIGNEAVFTGEPYAKVGLTGMDLLRLALERASSAAGAVEVITRLLDEHGQGGGCGHEQRSFTYHNSFLVADARGAFVVETAGRKHAVERVDEGARSISNGLTIRGFADEHRDRLRGAVAACEARRALTTAAAAHASSAHDVMTALRCHGATEWPRYSLLNGTLSMPCMHGGGLVASSVSTASWVAELGDGRARHWVTATSAPCLSLYKPVHVDEPLDLGPAPTDRDDGGASLWWAQERLHRAVLRDPERLAPLFLGERDQVQRRWLERPPSSKDAFNEGRRLLDQWRARVSEVEAADRRPPWARRYWARREKVAGSTRVVPPRLPEAGPS